MRSLAALVLLGAATTAFAQAPEASKLVTLDASVAAGPSAGHGTLTVRARIAPGWHVNSHKPTEDYLIPTVVQVEPAAGARVGEARYPDGKMLKFSFSDTPLSVYTDAFSVDVPVEWPGEAPPPLRGALAFQACNDRQCLAPASLPFAAAVSSGAPPPPSASAAAPVLSGGAVPLSEARRLEGSSTAAAGASQDFGDLLARRGLPAVLLLLLGWGLALNLTPCVYPVIPLTISFFGGQSPGDTGRTFSLAAVYVLGMCTMYSALGVAAALSGRLFGAALQSPWVLGGVAAVLVALAFSMFGLYDIRMPTALMQKAGARRGLSGAYAMGLLVGVVAAPCVGPVVLGLLAFVAATQNAALGFLFFFVLSLGLGLPFLFLAAFSGRIASLPRAGAWMEGVKKIFGWILLAMAAYFLRTALPGAIGKWLLPVVLVLAAVSLLAVHTSLTLRVRTAVAVVFLASALFFSPLAESASAGPLWAPYDETRIASSQRPSVVDFSASWCLPCIELDRKTFSDARVRKGLERRELFKADMTRIGAPETAALAQKFEILGVPTVIFLDASGQERRDLRLVGFEDADAFLRRLEKAR